MKIERPRFLEWPEGGSVCCQTIDWMLIGKGR